MKALVFLFLMSSYNADTLSTPQKSYFKQSIVYEAIIETLDGSSTHGFVISLDDSSITISQKIQANTIVDSKKYLNTNIANIKMIRLKGNRAANGLWKGAVIGFGIGAITGFVSGNDPPNQIIRFSAGDKAAVVGILFCLIGSLLGVVIGAFSKKKYEFKIDGNKENFDNMLLKLKYKTENN